MMNLSALNAKAGFSGGNGYPVTLAVEYSATQELDIRGFIQLNSAPWDTYGGKTITVARSKGTLEIEFQVSETIPVANGAYKFVVNLLPVGAGWNDRIDEIIIPEISVVVFVDGVGIDNCLEGDLPKGDSHQLTATVTPTNASNQSLTWSSSDTDVATVNENGLVTGINDGTANIIVTTNYGSFTDICAVSVTTIPVSGVNLVACPETELIIVNTHQLAAEVTPANAYDKSITWSSSGETIASIDENGLITAVSEGSATISVTTNDGSFTANCDVNIVPLLDAGVSISGCQSENLFVGSKHQLKANINPINAHNQTVNWTSSDTLIVKVDASGILEAVSVGNAVITVTTEDGGYADDCTVFVESMTSVSPGFKQKVNDVKIFPNPSSGILSLEFSENDANRKVLIYNSIGQILFDEKIEDLHRTIDITKVISCGFIYVQIQSAQNVSTHKVSLLK